MAQLDEHFNRDADGAAVHRVRFDDLGFCDLYSGVRFETLMAEAVAASRAAPTLAESAQGRVL